MKQNTITITFNADKLDALRQFTPNGKPSVDVEMLVLIDKLYQRYVPAPVRSFIDNRSPDEAGVQDKRRKKPSPTAEGMAIHGNRTDRSDAEIE